MALYAPVTTSLDGMDSTYTYIKQSGQFRSARTFFQQRTDEQHVPFVKYGSTILGTLICLMLYSVINVFIRGPIAYVGSGIIIAVAIYMTNYHTRRSRSDEGFGYDYMYAFRHLRPIFRSFSKGYGQIVCRRVRLSDKPLPVFDNCYTPKVANFITIMPNNRFPNLWSICHG